MNNNINNDNNAVWEAETFLREQVIFDGEYDLTFKEALEKYDEQTILYFGCESTSGWIDIRTFKTFKDRLEEYNDYLYRTTSTILNSRIELLKTKNTALTNLCLKIEVLESKLSSNGVGYTIEEFEKLAEDYESAKKLKPEMERSIRNTERDIILIRTEIENWVHLKDRKVHRIYKNGMGFDWAPKGLSVMIDTWVPGKMWFPGEIEVLRKAEDTNYDAIIFKEDK